MDTILMNPGTLLMRDNWRCQLCGDKVNKKLLSPHLMAPSLDHIIPFTKGGTHERKNVQLAHLSCNMKKHNGTTIRGDQLRIF